MPRTQTLLVILAACGTGFVAGFISRPLITPTQQTEISATPPSAVSRLTEARGTQYFLDHIPDAHRVIAGCREGSIRGDECASAQEAIIKVDAEERRRKFLGN